MDEHSCEIESSINVRTFTRNPTLDSGPFQLFLLLFGMFSTILPAMILWCFFKPSSRPSSSHRLEKDVTFDPDTHTMIINDRYLDYMNKNAEDSKKRDKEKQDKKKDKRFQVEVGKTIRLFVRSWEDKDTQ